MNKKKHAYDSHKNNGDTNKDPLDKAGLLEKVGEGLGREYNRFMDESVIKQLYKMIKD